MRFRPEHGSVSMLVACLALARFSAAATLHAGPGRPYATPCMAIAAAAAGDTIEIDAAGQYDGDVCAITKDRLTLRGVGGRAKVAAAGKNYGGKGTWVISGNDTTVENIEFSGATVPDQNGAGIRQEGNNLTVRGCYFHDNDDGILTSPGVNSQILIEYTEFARNGFGDGFSHNMYIGHVARFTIRYSYSHDSKIGHLVKSRAAENYVLYNRLTGETGTSSYEIDLPNGGTSFVIGNVIEQGSSTDNPTMLAYGEEGAAPENPGHELFVVNNTFANDRAAGATFIAIGAAMMTPAVVRNNVFAGTGTQVNQAAANLASNFEGGDPMFVDRAAFDYHLRAGSPCINAGTDPGIGGGMALAPLWQYVHPASAEGRSSVGAIDIGAFELGGATDAGLDGAMGGQGSGGGSTTSTAAVGGSAQGAGPAEDTRGCGCRTGASRRRAGPTTSLSVLVSIAAASALCRRRRQRVARTFASDRT